MASDSSSLHSSRVDRHNSLGTRSYDGYLAENVLEGKPGRYPSTKATTPDVYDAPDRRMMADSASQRIVIGIDYGTTNTGVAFAAPRSDTATLNEITFVYDWGPRMGNFCKIPSAYSYSRSYGREQQWGKDFSPDAVILVNTKLELAVQDRKLDELELTLQVLEGTKHLSFQKLKESGGDAEHTWKSPEDIIADYMTKVLEYLYQDFERFIELVKKQIPVDIVITVPVDWPYEAKNSTFRAIRQSGFNEATFPKLNNMLLITEPEAAAIFTARYLKDDKRTQFLKLNDCFILADAGGGTVDVIAYQVKQLEPELQLRPVGYPSSGRCGSAHINTEFKRWLFKLIGRDNYFRLDPKNAGQRISSLTVEGGQLRNLMKDFEIRKCLFSNNSGTMNIDLPPPLDRLTVRDKIENGQLSITHDEMRKFFHRYVNEVIGLILDQRTQVEKGKNRRVKNVFLVGGFGESPFLQEEIQEALGLRRTVLRRPDERQSWTAVVQGAVIYGIEKAHHRNLSLMSATDRNYGIVVDEIYSAYKFGSEDVEIDKLTKKAIARKQFAWMIRQGDLILSSEKRVAEKEFTFTFQAHEERKLDLPIYEYSADDDDDDMPERWATGQHDVNTVGSLTCDLTQFSVNNFERSHNLETNEPYYTAYLVCKMHLSKETLEVEVQVNEMQVGHTTITIGDSDDRSISSDY